MGTDRPVGASGTRPRVGVAWRAAGTERELYTRFARRQHADSDIQTSALLLVWFPTSAVSGGAGGGRRQEWLWVEDRGRLMFDQGNDSRSYTSRYI